MKKLAAILITLGFATTGYTQTTWNLNFGIGTGQFVIAANSAIESSVSQSPNLDVPTPSPSSTQVVRLRMSNPISGKFELVNTGATIGSGSRLKITAPTSTSSNKFSIYNIGATTKLMRVRFKVRFDAGTNGEQIFSVGNNDGGLFYSNGSGIVDGGFASMQWNLGASKHAFSYFKNTSSNNSTTAISEALNPVIAGFTPNSEHTIEVFCNNTAIPMQYASGSTNYTVAAGKWHIWVNGTQLFSAAAVTDFDAGILGANTNLNAIAFNSKSSTTQAITYLDDFEYTDFLPAPVLPVTLVSFQGNKQAAAIALRWATASEVNNSHFLVQKSADGTTFETIARIKGAGTSNQLNNYYFTDHSPLQGTNYFRLTQVDFDGKSTSSNLIAVNFGLGDIAMKVLTGNVNDKIELIVSAEQDQQGTLDIFTINGGKAATQKLSLQKGNNRISVALPSSAKGVFVASLQTSQFLVKTKFVK
ncbi:hypothetical protein [Nubsella zeaxanthinifaciens]|uniref:hypothetical protein n=1 Tax=Nubsella zeaxanthinifaciens TaxID=392412 RepID=UPI000DE4781D|nr:hypothetical protein [Nubsella zeaxanthinifaciens]